MIRLGALIVGVILAAVAIWHPVPRAPAATIATTPPPRAKPRMTHTHRTPIPPLAAVVYVVGAVSHPGLYRVAPTRPASILPRTSRMVMKSMFRESVKAKSARQPRGAAQVAHEPERGRARAKASPPCR